MHASILYFLSQPSILQPGRYVRGVFRECVCAHVCDGGGVSAPRIRPQKMLIRVDLGTWSGHLIDRVQGQTSPWGAMILSLIVHTHTSLPPADPGPPPPPLPSPLTHTPLLYTHHRQNKSVSGRQEKKKREEEEEGGLRE